MSHVTRGKAVHTSLEAIKRAMRKFTGARFKENPGTYNSYQPSQKCVHSIHLDGCSYEVGIQNTAKPGQPPRWALEHDNYSDGQKLDKVFGPQLNLLHQEIARQTTILDYQKNYMHKGYTLTERKLPNGKIQISLISMKD